MTGTLVKGRLVTSGVRIPQSADEGLVAIRGADGDLTWAPNAKVVGSELILGGDASISRVAANELGTADKLVLSKSAPALKLSNSPRDTNILMTDAAGDVKTTPHWGQASAPAAPASLAVESEWMPSGAKLENMPRARTPLANVAMLTSGTLRLFPLGVLRAGHTLSSITLLSGATQAGTPLNQWAGIVRATDRNLRAVSANGTTGAWAAVTFKTFTFTSPYTPAADELLWGCLMVGATTVPTLTGITTNAAASMGTPAINGNSNTTQTTPLAVGTIVTAPTAAAGIPYAYAS